jgi:hypothetical protein
VHAVRRGAERVRDGDEEGDADVAFFDASAVSIASSLLVATGVGILSIEEVAVVVGLSLFVWKESAGGMSSLSFSGI